MALLRCSLFALFCFCFPALEAQVYPSYYLYHRSGKIEKVSLISCHDTFVRILIEGVVRQVPMSEIDSLNRQLPKHSNKKIGEVIRANLPYLDSVSTLGYYGSVSRGFMLSGIENNFNYGLCYQAVRSRHSTIGMNIGISLFSRRQVLLVPVSFEGRFYSNPRNPLKPGILGYSLGYVLNLYSPRIIDDGGPCASIFGGMAFPLGSAKRKFVSVLGGIKTVIAGNERYNIPINQQVRGLWFSPEIRLEVRL